MSRTRFSLTVFLAATRLGLAILLAASGLSSAPSVAASGVVAQIDPVLVQQMLADSEIVDVVEATGCSPALFEGERASTVALIEQGQDGLELLARAMDAGTGRVPLESVRLLAPEEAFRCAVDGGLRLFIGWGDDPDAARASLTRAIRGVQVPAGP